METFAPPKDMVEDLGFADQRQGLLADWDPECLDPPMRFLMRGFNSLSYCFTLQSCCGHFLVNGRGDPLNLERLPTRAGGATVEYRIAYVALALQNSLHGRALCKDLEAIAEAEPKYIQFGSAQWFWDKRPNTYALQVEPLRFQDRDTCMVDHAEALVLEQVRDRFLLFLRGVLKSRGFPPAMRDF